MIRFPSAALVVSAALVGTALPATAIDPAAPDGAAAANAIDVASRAPAASLFTEGRTSPPSLDVTDASGARAQSAGKKSWRATIFDAGYVRSRVKSSVRECTPSFA